MWKDLTMQQRADLMDIYLNSGIYSLNEMKSHYDSRKKFEDGGNLFDGTNENSQQINRPNIFRYDDGRYVYQAAPNAEEIDVTPINTLIPDASQWTYQDAEGRVYTPHAAQVDTGNITQDEDTNPLMRAANNYVRELSWRAQNDPSSIALQGKYTMPAVLSPLLAPIGEVAYPYVSAALTNPYVDAGLTSAFAGHGLNHWINEGTNGWGDAAMTALEIAPLGQLAKPMWYAGKEGLQYAAKVADNTARYTSPSYDLYRTIGETPVANGSLQKSLVEDFGVFEGPKRVTFFDTPYRQRIEGSNIIKEPAILPEQYGLRLDNYGQPEVLGKDGRWHLNPRKVKGKFRDPIDHSIWTGKESIYQPDDYLFHYDVGDYPVYYDANGNSMLSRVPDETGDLGPIWWNKNSQWDIYNADNIHPRVIKVPDYGNYRQAASYYQKGDSNAILTEDYPLKDAEFLERDNLVGTMGRGIFAQQSTPKTIETPTIHFFYP